MTQARAAEARAATGQPAAPQKCPELLLHEPWRRSVPPIDPRNSVTSPVFPFELLITAVCGWLHRGQADLIAFLREENRVLKARLRGRRLRLADDERLGELGHRLRRRLLAQVATVVTPDTILRWHRELVDRCG